MKARAHSSPWRQAVEVLLVTNDGRGFVLPEGITITTPDSMEDCFGYAPSFSMSPEQAQTLMDDLWNCGLRPTEGTGSAGALRAVERHLEDMRTLVFKEKKD